MCGSRCSCFSFFFGCHFVNSFLFNSRRFFLGAFFFSCGRFSCISGWFCFYLSIAVPPSRIQRQNQNIQTNTHKPWQNAIAKTYKFINERQWPCLARTQISNAAIPNENIETMHIDEWRTCIKRIRIKSIIIIITFARSDCAPHPNLNPNHTHYKQCLLNFMALYFWTSQEPSLTGKLLIWA